MACIKYIDYAFSLQGVVINTGLNVINTGLNFFFHIAGVFFSRWKRAACSTCAAPSGAVNVAGISCSVSAPFPRVILQGFPILSGSIGGSGRPVPDPLPGSWPAGSVRDPFQRGRLLPCPGSFFISPGCSIRPAVSLFCSSGFKICPARFTLWGCFASYGFGCAFSRFQSLN